MNFKIISENEVVNNAIQQHCSLFNTHNVCIGRVNLIDGRWYFKTRIQNTYEFYGLSHGMEKVHDFTSEDLIHISDILKDLNKNN